MSKLKSILTLFYSSVFAGLLYFFLYLISREIKINFTESLFLIALVLVIMGIVVLIANGARQKAFFIEEEETSDIPRATKSVLIGFNSLTIILTGVFLLVVDAILK